MFIESAEQPDKIAEKCLQQAGGKFSLISISNRGTQVWPTGSMFTDLVNQYNVRFESADGSALTQKDVVKLQEILSQQFKICSHELLNTWGNIRAYSLAQGQ
jgi:isocitrate dehydrogenase